MSTHTPGPWIVFVRPDGFVILPAGRDGRITGSIDSSADADLIAAAPKLLLACKTMIEAAQIADEMLDVLDKPHDEIKQAIRLAQQFVADAEGRT